MKKVYKNEELIRKAKEGDTDSEIELLQANEKLCYHIAFKYNNTGIEINDLASIGKIGLIKAYQGFDLNREVKFATYAAMVINNEILMYLRKNKRHKNNVSLDDVLNRDTDGNELTLVDTISAPENDIRYEDMEALNKALKIFNDNAKERDKQILQMYFYEEKTQLEIAKAIGVSQSYIARIMTSIEKTLRIIAETGEFKKVCPNASSKEKATNRRQINSYNKKKIRKKENKMADKKFFKSDFVYIFTNYSLKNKEISDALSLRLQTVVNYRCIFNKGEWNKVKPKIQNHVLEMIETYIAKNRQENYNKVIESQHAMIERTEEIITSNPHNLDEIKPISPRIEDAKEMDKFIEAMVEPKVETKTLKVEIIKKKDIKILNNQISLTSSKEDMANIILGIYELLKNTPEGSMVKMDMEFEVTKQW